jgi:hypothetical protein
MEPASERERALSTGSAPGGSSRAAQVTEVVLDGSALLRIVKHCEDNLPGASTGALLGLDVAREDGGAGLAMHVTYAFALPRGRGEDVEAEEGGGGHHGDDEAARAEYRRHMMKLLKEVRVLHIVCVQCVKSQERACVFIGLDWIGLDWIARLLRKGRKGVGSEGRAGTKRERPVSSSTISRN